MSVLNLEKKNQSEKNKTIPLGIFLRSLLTQWKKDSLHVCNYKCIITGESKDIHIHHLYGNSKIVSETLNELKLPIHSSVTDYTTEEIKRISEKYIEIHYRYPLGVCIKKELHRLFHLKYGSSQHTVEDFIKFVKEDYQKEIKPQYAKGKKLKYYPHQKRSTSKFHGVAKHKSDSRTANRNDNYVARITYLGERIQIGFFPTEVEAAYHYNLKAKELFGGGAILNQLTSEEIALAEHKIKYFDYRENEETIYSCVRYDKPQWQVEFTHNGTRHYAGRFQTDIEAAFAYNYYVQKHKLDRKLNFITDDSFDKQAIVETIENDNYFSHKTKGKSIYSCVKQERSGNWVAKTKLNKKEIHIGTYPTDKEAAIAYNEYVLEHKLNKKLNKII